MTTSKFCSATIPVSNYGTQVPLPAKKKISVIRAFCVQNIKSLEVFIFYYSFFCIFAACYHIVQNGQKRSEQYGNELFTQ